VQLEIRMWSAKAQLLPAVTAPPWPPVIAPAPPALRKSGAFALHMDRRVSFWTRISTAQVENFDAFPLALRAASIEFW